MRLAVLAAATTGFVGCMVVASTGLALIVATGLVCWSLAQRALDTLFGF